MVQLVSCSKNLAVTPLLLPHWHPCRCGTTRTAVSVALASIPCRFCLCVKLVLASYGDVNGFVEDLVNSAELFRRALHVEGAHLLRDGFALLLRDGREALGLQKLNAGALVA